MTAGPASPEQRRQVAAGWLRFLSVIAFLVLWQGVASILDSRLLPGPASVAIAVLDHTRDGSLPYHVAITLARVMASFALAMVVGAAIGMSMGMSRTVNGFLDIWLVVGLNVPALVVIILSYVWLGLTETALLVAVAVNKIPVVAATLREGTRAIDRDLADVARAFRLPQSTMVAKIYLPQLSPYLLAAARTGLALIWKIVLVVELLGRSEGVGFQLGVFFQFFDIRGILAYTAAFVLLILAIEIMLMQPLERWLARWRP